MVLMLTQHCPNENIDPTRMCGPIDFETEKKLRCTSKCRTFPCFCTRLQDNQFTVVNVETVTSKYNLYLGLSLIGAEPATHNRVCREMQE